LLVALRYGRSTSLSRVVAAGVASARRVGSAPRAELLARVQRLGAAALSEPAVSRPLIHRAGPSEGGALGALDLSSVPELDHPARRRGLRCEVPWLESWADFALDHPAVATETERRQRGLCVVDGGGGVAALCYDAATVGLPIDELDELLALNAIPVRRGQRRVTPGQVLAAPAPLVIELSDQGVPVAARVDLAERGPLQLWAPARRELGSG
jgi:hypothetical protein